jgi:hypothetical protein
VVRKAEDRLDRGPVLASRVDCQRPTEQLGALEHAGKPESGPIGPQIEPTAIVADRYADRVVALDDLD